MPQTLRASLGYDRDLGHNLVGTVEGLYTRAIYAPFYYNLALTDPIGTDANGRVLYGTRPYNPSLVVPSRNTVIDVGNENNDHFYNLTGQLTRRFADNWEGSVPTRTAAAGTCRASPPARRIPSTATAACGRAARWTRRQPAPPSSSGNRIVAQGSYTFPTLTTVSLIYTGASGIAVQLRLLERPERRRAQLQRPDLHSDPGDRIRCSRTPPSAARTTRPRSRRTRSTSSSTTTSA